MGKNGGIGYTLVMTLPALFFTLEVIWSAVNPPPITSTVLGGGAFPSPTGFWALLPLFGGRDHL